jgi:hypothetical protein
MGRIAVWIFAVMVGCSGGRAADFGQAAAYPHQHPKHIALECRDCHSLKAGETESHEMPGHATCTACHNFADEAVRRTESFCGECHTAADATGDRPALYAFPRPHATHDFGDLFSHAAHRNAGNATRCEAPGVSAQSHCADCHAAAPAPAGQPDKQLEASHAFCFACHCEQPRGYSAERKNMNPARNDCAVCHVSREGAMAAFPAVKDFRHADHVFDTRPRLKSAGPVSRDPDILCMECHRGTSDSGHLSEARPPAAATCGSCHTGKPGLPDPLTAEVLRSLERRQ